ncbi:MAG TPA: SMP-30/gluconolactonase/LRE family protein [Vicinamibacteria bacterium]|nr:SMP-30/gluconolactonase/LRE family protein [Vicinamibacteria bacterium]
MVPALPLLLVLVAPLEPAADPPPTPAQEVDRIRGFMAEAPGNGGVMYRLAQALARAEQADEAVRWLDAALDQGLDLDLADPAFASLADRSDFAELKVKTIGLAPVSSSRIAFRIAESDLVPEGIAWDEKTGDFFVGSLAQRKIVRVGADGRASDFAKSAADGLEDVLGLKVDPSRRVLWACTAASPRAGAAAGSSALFKYDLATGRFAKAYWIDNKDGKHLLNDVALTTDGDVFVTDSDASTVWRLAPGSDGLEVFVGPGSFLYPNGIALAPDGKRLYVADFKRGLSVVDVATKASRPLPFPAGVSTAGIDGLYTVGGDLVAVQNGAGRERIVRYRLDPTGERILALEVLESRNPFFRTPTTGVPTSDAFVYLANPNLDALDDDGNVKKDARKDDEVVVLRTPLR